MVCLWLGAGIYDLFACLGTPRRGWDAKLQIIKITVLHLWGEAISTTVERNTIKKLDEHPDWQNGFNSGCLAIVRLFQEYNRVPQLTDYK